MIKKTDFGNSSPITTDLPKLGLNDSRRGGLDYILHLYNHFSTFDCAHSRSSGSLHRVLNNGTHIYKHLPCGRWSCLTCGRLKATLLFNSIVAAINQHHLLTFITLTLPPDSPPDERPSLIKKAFASLWRSLVHSHPASQYIWVLGGRSAADTHLHIITNCPVTRKQLKNRWFLITHAFEVDVRPVNNTDGMAAYLVKNYLFSRRTGAGKRLHYSKGLALDVAGRSTDKPKSDSGYRWNSSSTSDVVQVHGSLIFPAGTLLDYNPKQVVVPTPPRSWAERSVAHIENSPVPCPDAPVTGPALDGLGTASARRGLDTAGIETQRPS